MAPDTESPFEAIADARPEDSAWPRLQWPPEPDLVLEGASVRLIPLDPDRDAAELYAALDDDSVWTHLAGRPRNVAEYARGLRDSILAGRFAWAIQLVEPQGDFPAGALVGTSSYLDISVLDSRLEIGWTAYAHSVWGGTVNPEAKLLLLAYAFDVLGAGRVQLKTDARNTRSQRAIARLGAQYEGSLRRYQRRSDDTIRDTVMFSIIAEEWPTVRDNLLARLEALQSPR